MKGFAFLVALCALNAVYAKVYLEDKFDDGKRSLFSLCRQPANFIIFPQIPGKRTGSTASTLARSSASLSSPPESSTTMRKTTKVTLFYTVYSLLQIIFAYVQSGRKTIKTNASRRCGKIFDSPEKIEGGNLTYHNFLLLEHLKPPRNFMCRSLGKRMSF